MSLRVIKSTDGKYLGLTLSIDPRDPPPAIPAGDGAVFHPLWWLQIKPGLWRAWNSNYSVFAEEL